MYFAKYQHKHGGICVKIPPPSTPNRRKKVSHFELMLRDYRLTTAEILYHLPDHPVLLQSYIWQEFDIAPDFPVLMKFLSFWEKEIEGKLHSVKVTSCELIKPAMLDYQGSEFRLQ